MEFHKILVPVVGTEADEEAIRLACNLVKKKNKGKIYVVYVITIKRALPLDAEIESETLKDAGPAIVDETVERGVDLILMGVKYKRRFGQFSLGSVAPYVLKNAPCRVILYHQYIT